MSTKSFLAGALLGAAAGCISVAILTPHNGKELRCKISSDVKNAYSTSTKFCKEKMETLQNTTEE